MRAWLALALALMAAVPAHASSRLAGALNDPALWQAYKAAFISPGGRVIDNANGDVSHSEGQGYGMLLAVAANDPQTFEALWTWTRSQLMLRDDGLAAWRWDPAATPHVGDRNNASDGDLLIAWALAEAGEAWAQAPSRTAALALARAIASRAVVETRFGPVLMPGVAGFGAGERPDGPVVNLSYWVFPALARLAQMAPDRPFAVVSETGLRLATLTRLGPRHLPSDWISLAGETPVPAQRFPARFGYDAIRIPLYLVWAGQRGAALAPYAALFADAAATPHVVDIVSGNDLEPLGDSGYQAVAALVRCAVQGTPFPGGLRAPDVDRYYPSTLRLFALIAARQADLPCK